MRSHPYPLPVTLVHLKASTRVKRNNSNNKKLPCLAIHSVVAPFTSLTIPAGQQQQQCKQCKRPLFAIIIADQTVAFV